ncbi:hypothetical protein [Microvirga brassicacearum]|uniref:Uncharacterized protein n=1 Tax=Microvirga brassicacearum TaxID=2580413 RepID=A0A5N3PBX1_9HYPH|nr:hypothetical protein [Microvirga brassicacearum]KAB0267247.1 hypothetical protein FEZ63_07920 [Microvirga brassicacearum]
MSGLTGTGPGILGNSFGAWRRAPDCHEEIPFNGDLTFTDLSSASSLAYVACFIDGHCVRILTEDQHKRLMEAGRRLVLSDNIFEDLMRDGEPSVRRSKPFAPTKPEEVYGILHDGREPVPVENMRPRDVRRVLLTSETPDDILHLLKDELDKLDPE